MAVTEIFETGTDLNVQVLVFEWSFTKGNDQHSSNMILSAFTNTTCAPVANQSSRSIDGRVGRTLGL